MRWCALILALLIIGVFACPAYSAKRVALVIGNSDYQSVPLKNPVNDAIDISRTLQDIGFSVIIRTDADRQGMQVSDSNYLIPLDTSINSSSDVQFEAVNVIIHQVMRQH